MRDLEWFQHAFVRGLSARAVAATPMRIYRNTVLLGAVDALRDNFPVIRALLGDEAFSALAAAHAEMVPPDSPILAHYGRHFPSWLADHPIASDLPYLAEVAACERLWLQALHAADEPALDLAALQEIAIDELLALPLALHAAAGIAWHENPAVAIWLAHQDAAVDEIAPAWRAAGALYTRPELTVTAFEITAAEYRLLSGIRLGESLGASAEAVLSRHPNTDVGLCFAGLVQRGAFATLAQERPTS